MSNIEPDEPEDSNELIDAIDQEVEPAEPIDYLLEMRKRVKEILNIDHKKLKKHLPISPEDENEENNLKKSDINFIRRRVKKQLRNAKKFQSKSLLGLLAFQVQQIRAGNFTIVENNATYSVANDIN